MSGIDATRDGRLARVATNWVLCADRRQCRDRRNGLPRGGRRLTDPAPDPMHSAIWENARYHSPQVDKLGFWAAAAKLKSTFRQICFSALAAVHIAINLR